MKIEFLGFSKPLEKKLREKLVQTIKPKPKKEKKKNGPPRTNKKPTR